jgi:hypothetical protein
MGNIISPTTTTTTQLSRTTTPITIQIPINTTGQESALTKSITALPQNTIPQTTVKQLINESTSNLILSKQNALQTELINLLQNTNKPAATITNRSNGQLAEGFANSSSVVSTYQPPIILPPSNIPEIKDYITAYNKAVSLLDDPNNLNQANFDAYIALQDKKIVDLQKAINSYPTKSNQLNKPIRAIKNLQTSTAINLEPFPDTNTNNGSVSYPNYLIYGNNGCLQYTNGDSTLNSAATWEFQKCHANEAGQRFYLNKINNINDYNSKITDFNMQNYRITDPNSSIFGFYVVNPELDNSQCLQINQDGLSVMPCNMDSSQRFKPFYHNINP